MKELEELFICDKCSIGKRLVSVYIKKEIFNNIIICKVNCPSCQSIIKEEGIKDVVHPRETLGE